MRVSFPKLPGLDGKRGQSLAAWLFSSWWDSFICNPAHCLRPRCRVTSRSPMTAIKNIWLGRTVRGFISASSLPVAHSSRKCPVLVGKWLPFQFLPRPCHCLPFPPMAPRYWWRTKLARQRSMDRYGSCPCSAALLVGWETPLVRPPHGRRTAKRLFTPTDTTYG